MVSPTTLQYRRRRRLMIKIFGRVCEFCSSSRKLTFAHARPTKLSGMGRGSLHRIRDVEDNPDCYKLLCYSCHVEYDRKQADEQEERESQTTYDPDVLLIGKHIFDKVVT